MKTTYQLHIKLTQEENQELGTAYNIYCHEQILNLSLNQFVIRLIKLGLQHDEK